MAGLSDARLRAWSDFFRKFPGYAQLQNDFFESYKQRTRTFWQPTEYSGTTFGLFLPIIDKQWAIKNVNGVIKNGLFLALAREIIIFDFDQSKYYEYSYSNISRWQRDGSVISLTMSNDVKIALTLRLDVNRKMVKGVFGILLGLSTITDNDHVRGWENRDFSQKVSEEAGNEIDSINHYQNSIFNFINEAVNGIPDKSSI
jgi:hypothetical protein